MTHQLYLVTGAAQGIGAAVATHLLANQQRVIMLDCDQRQLMQSYAELPAAQQACAYPVVFDLAEHAQIPTFVAQLEQRYGALDGVASCAGVLSLGPINEPTFATSLARMMAVNFVGASLLMQQVAGAMAQRGQGSVVAVSSNAATTPRKAMAGYCCSKAALQMFVRCLGLELAERGVRCNSVSPGSTRTPMQTQMWRDGYQEADTIAGDLSQSRLGIPLQKLAEPADIARAVWFLLSPDAAHITMQDLKVDGGATY